MVNVLANQQTQRGISIHLVSCFWTSLYLRFWSLSTSDRNVVAINYRGGGFNPMLLLSRSRTLLRQTLNLKVLTLSGQHVARYLAISVCLNG